MWILSSYSYIVAPGGCAPLWSPLDPALNLVDNFCKNLTYLFQNLDKQQTKIPDTNNFLTKNLIKIKTSADLAFPNSQHQTQENVAISKY